MQLNVRLPAYSQIGVELDNQKHWYQVCEVALLRDLELALQSKRPC